MTGQQELSISHNHNRTLSRWPEKSEHPFISYINLAIKVCWCPQLLKLQVAHPLLDKTCIKHIACKLSGNAITFPHTISTSYTG